MREKVEARFAATEPSRRWGWAVAGLALAALLGAHAWYWWRAGDAIEPTPPLLMARGGAAYEVTHDVPRQVLEELIPDRAAYIRERKTGGGGKVVGYHFYWEPRPGNANRLHHRPDSCMPLTGWRQAGEVRQEKVEIGGRLMDFNVFPFEAPGGPVLIYWGAYLNGELVGQNAGAGLQLPTTKLWEYIRTGTRRQSYEVAAFLVPYSGESPTRDEVSRIANEFFARASEQTPP